MGKSHWEEPSLLRQVPSFTTSQTELSKVPSAAMEDMRTEMRDAIRTAMMDAVKKYKEGCNG